MDVSIIIVNYNTFDVTCRCLSKVLEKTSGVDYEIIVVDNASTECNPDRFLESFPNVRLVKSLTNTGFAKGNNLGLSQATGDYLVLLNSDAFLVNNAIGLCLDFLSTNPNVGVVTGRLQYPDGRIQNNCQRFPSVWVWLFEKLRLQKFLPARIGGNVLMGSFFSYQDVAYPDWVWGTFFMFRKQDLEIFPNRQLADDFFMYGEDTQWCMEFRRVGFQVAFLPQAKIEHLMGASGAPKAELMAQNRKRFMAMYYPRWHRKILETLSIV